jgi:hypothetical protein
MLAHSTQGRIGGSRSASTINEHHTLLVAGVLPTLNSQFDGHVMTRVWSPQTTSPLSTTSSGEQERVESHLRGVEGEA